MIVYVLDIAKVLSIFVLMAVSFHGWGWLASRILGFVRQAETSVVRSIWLGWAFSLLIFQIVHLFLPLNAYVVIPVFLAGILASIPRLPATVRSYFRENPVVPGVVFLVAFAATACWVAARAMKPMLSFDAGLYYFNMIRWINEYPIVPGLGNLHNRLAFNQTFFIYVAALNFYPFFIHGNSFANSFLYLLTLATLVSALRPVFSRPALLVESHPFLYIPALLALPILVYLVFSSSGGVLPAADLTSTFLQICMFVMLLRGAAAWIGETPWSRGEIMTLAVLAATAITIKLSNLAFSAVLMGFCLAYLWHISEKRFRSLAAVFAPVAVILLVWVLQGYVLSGAPLYPSSIGYLPLKWAIPRDVIIEQANVIYAQARWPYRDWQNVLSNWNWLKPWFDRVRQNSSDQVVIPFISALAFLGLTLVAAMIARKRRRRMEYREWVILLPSAASIMYWFFTAPDPRFTSALFWLLSAGATLLLILYLQPLLGSRAAMAGAVLILFLAASFPFARSIATHYSLIGDVSRTGWTADKTVPLVEKQTLSGLTILAPKTGNQCWDSPIPCTPLFNEHLRELVPGRLGSGFFIAPSP